MGSDRTPLDISRSPQPPVAKAARPPGCSQEEEHAMRKWSLGQLTVMGVKPYELVELAARAGYDAVDPFVGIVQFPGVPMVPLRKGEAETNRMLESMKANGITVNTGDAFLITGENDEDVMARAVDLMAEMGAG